jgi:hypothetical protein
MKPAPCPSVARGERRLRFTRTRSLRTSRGRHEALTHRPKARREAARQLLGRNTAEVRTTSVAGDSFEPSAGGPEALEALSSARRARKVKPQASLGAGLEMRWLSGNVPTGVVLRVSGFRSSRSRSAERCVVRRPSARLPRFFHHPVRNAAHLRVRARQTSRIRGGLDWPEPCFTAARCHTSAATATHTLHDPTRHARRRRRRARASNPGCWWWTTTRRCAPWPKRRSGAALTP